MHKVRKLCSFRVSLMPWTRNRLIKHPQTSILSRYAFKDEIHESLKSIAMDDIDGSFDFANDIGRDISKCPFTAHTKVISKSNDDNLPLIKICQNGRPQLLLKDPDTFNQVFGWEVKGNAKQSTAPSLNPILGEANFFTKTGEEHIKYRNQFRIPLSKKTLSNNQFYTKMISNECEKHLFNIINDSKINNIDFLDYTRSLTWNIGLKFLFGDTVVNDELNKQLFELMSLILSGLGDKEYYVSRNVKIGGSMWVALKAKDEYSGIMSNILNKVELMYNNNELDTNTALYQFFHETTLLKNDNEIGWDRNEFILTLFVALLETTANSMSTLLYCIGKYPQQYDLLKEMLSNDQIGQKLINPNLNYPLSESKFDQIDGLSCLHWFIQESMRLFPVCQALQRISTKENDLNGVKIPPNMFVTYPSAHFHRSEQYWGEDSNEFKFVRFENRDENKENTKRDTRKVMIPFGAGNRQCIGTHLAYLELKILLLTFIRNDLKIDIDESSVKDEWNFLARVKYLAKLTQG